MSYERDYRGIELPGVGRVGLLLPVIREDAEPVVREGLARRRLTLLTGRCPCGARLHLPNRATRRAMKRDRARGGGVWQVDVEHENDCPATDPRLDEVTSA